MDFIKETILTFSIKDKEEFERFLSRKQAKKQRKDILVFQELFKMYSSSSSGFKGDQNYHAIRKRLSKELANYLVLKQTTSQTSDDSTLLMIQHFVDLRRYEIAWELLLKVENGFENISWSSEESGETIEVSKAGQVLQKYKKLKV